MQEKFNPALVELPDEFVRQQHTGVPMDNVEAGGKDEHRPELDWHVQVEPIERPDLLC